MKRYLTAVTECGEIVSAVNLTETGEVVFGAVTGTGKHILSKLYTQLIGFKDDEFSARVAHSELESCQLIEAGFEFVCDFNGNKLFIKRK